MAGSLLNFARGISKVASAAETCQTMSEGSRPSTLSLSAECNCIIGDLAPSDIIESPSLNSISRKNIKAISIELRSEEKDH